MTRPSYDVANVAKEGFENLWSQFNTVDGRSVPDPVWIEVEEPGVGRSSRKLPSEKRTTPIVYVHENDLFNVEYADVNWNSQDYAGAVRFEIVVANEMHDRSGKQMREDLIQVFEDIREDQAAPLDGVFGTDWQNITLVNIDRTPTDYSNQWRAYYDVAFGSFGVI